MSLVALIAAELGAARTSPAARGANLIFERAGRFRTLRVIDEPHLELAIDVPELAGHRLQLQLGEPTVLGDAVPAIDPRWRVRPGISTDAGAVARALDGLLARVGPARALAGPYR